MSTQPPLCLFVLFQELVSIGTEGRTGDMTVLGHIQHKMVCSPDFEALLESNIWCCCRPCERGTVFFGSYVRTLSKKKEVFAITWIKCINIVIRNWNKFVCCFLKFVFPLALTSILLNYIVLILLYRHNYQYYYSLMYMCE